MNGIKVNDYEYEKLKDCLDGKGDFRALPTAKLLYLYQRLTKRHNDILEIADMQGAKLGKPKKWQAKYMQGAEAAPPVVETGSEVTIELAQPAEDLPF